MNDRSADQRATGVATQTSQSIFLSGPCIGWFGGHIELITRSAALNGRTDAFENDFGKETANSPEH
jgi:hypothetical protein